MSRQTIALAGQMTDLLRARAEMGMSALWGCTRPRQTNTATGHGRSNPPWHLLIDPAYAIKPRTACGKRLSGMGGYRAGIETPTDGPVCTTCAEIAAAVRA